MQWAKEQLEIIQHRQGNLLVSAAAGAGKTTVLVERIVQMIMDDENGTDLDRMLIVTFTNLAAGQMKDRIFKRLTSEIKEHPERERLKKQLALLPRCSIMTIHSFCLQVVRKYIAKLPQLDPGFRVGDENETALLAMDVLQDTVAEFYDRYDEVPESQEAMDFEAMVEQFGGTRQDLKLEPLLYRIYQFMQSLPEPWEWMDRAVAAYEDHALHGPLCGIRRVLTAFHKAFLEEKSSRAIVDYSDFEHYAKEILLEGDGPSQAAKELAEQYDYIFIDEYQDSNEIQEKILNSVARRDVSGQVNNVFMVGDVKQSIYGFRYACPQLFMEKLEAYHLDAAPKKIFLQNNYRSRREILEGANYVFESLMQEKCGGIEYSSEQALRSGRIFPAAEDDMADFRPQLHTLYMAEKDPKADKTEMEAAWAAEKIEEMLRNPWKYAVWDTDAYRPVQAKDIVILLRAAKEAGPVYQRALELRNIPASASTSNSFFDTREIRLVLNLLRIIDNAKQDIPLEGVLHSPLFGFSSEELAMVRTEMDRSLTFYEALQRYVTEGLDFFLGSRIADFFSQLEQWRLWSESLTVHELLLKLYRTTGLYEYVGAMKGGARRRANLELMLERSEEFEKGIYSGVFQFLRFIDRMKEKNQDYEEAADLQDEDAVQILTIHKSKGLEFPVVFLCGMGKQFQMRDSQGTVLLHPQLGMGCRWLDTRLMLEYETPLYQQIRQEKIQETLAEEMRILYVAMTRAKDRLIVSGMGPAEAPKLEKEQAYRIAPDQVCKAKTPMDWLYDIITQKEGSRWALFADPVGVVEAEVTEEKEEAVILTERWSEEELNAKLLWKYPHIWRNNLPMLLSVSALKQPLTENEDAPEIPWETLLSPVEEGQDETVYHGTYGGTLFHEVIARVDFAQIATSQGRRSELDRLEVQGILSKDERDTFPMHWLEKFVKAGICVRMRESSQVLKEESFMCGYTPGELHAQVPHFLVPQGADDHEMIVVQGVVDAAFLEDGQWVLVDYKTDRQFSEETLNMYRLQLSIYSRALENITGIQVKERILYQVRYGKEYFV